MRVGGRPVVVGQRHSNGGSSHRCPGFDSHAVAADFFTFLYFRLISFKLLS